MSDNEMLGCLCATIAILIVFAVTALLIEVLS